MDVKISYYTVPVFKHCYLYLDEVEKLPMYYKITSKDSIMSINHNLQCGDWYVICYILHISTYEKINTIKNSTGFSEDLLHVLK